MKLTTILILFAGLFVSSCVPAIAENTAIQKQTAERRYLLFQIFTYAGATAAKGSAFFPAQNEIGATAQDILNKVGSAGDLRNKLGFCVGPLTFNHSDDEIRRLIRESFQTARQKNIAVAFHIDDQMFWDERKDLIADKQNVEWLDWNGTLNTGRRLDWSEKPMKAPSQMCLNSPAIKIAVTNRAHLIGEEIRTQLDALKKEGREYLFAGVIAGWESMIGRDFATDRCLGYHALSNRGFSAKKPPKQINQELAQVIKEFVELWAGQLMTAGVPRDKIYAHIAFTPQGLQPSGGGPAQTAGVATPDVAFGRNYRPGFSTYPEEGALEEIVAAVHARRDVPWISSEGTNVVPNGMTGEATMETYLGKMFNHGAVMVNIFSWGIGGESQREKNIFRRATENDEAITAYRKFLDGKPLKESPRSANVFSPLRFRAKLDKIQREAPIWVRKTGRIDRVEPLMHKLDAAIKSGKFEEANAVADEILKVIGGS